MIIELLKQNLKRIRRSPEFQKRMATNIILGILIGLSMINFLYLSFNLNKLFRSIPGTNPVKLINEIVFLYFPADYILRLIFQKYRSVSVKPYLILNIPREKIADLILIKTAQSLLNLVPVILFLPFAFTELILHYSWISVTAWFMTIMFTCVFNAYLVNYTKIKFRIFPVQTVLINAAAIALVVLSAFLLQAYPKIWSVFMKVILLHPYMALTPLVGAMLMFQVNHRLLFLNLFIDEEEASAGTRRSREKELKENFSFLSSLGKAGQFILLEIKMVLRNKRPKPLFFISFLMIFYGLIFYSQKLPDEMLHLFIASFMTGVFIFSYGILVFGWESSYFGIIMTTNIDIKTYLKAKFYFMTAFTFILYVLMVFYILIDVRIYFIITSLFLFNTGVSVFIIMTMATYNKMKYRLEEGMWSQQGRGTQQYLGALIVFAMQLGLMFLLRLFLSFDQAIVVIGILGIAGLAAHSYLIALIEKLFFINKYEMIEGFRQT